MHKPAVPRFVQEFFGTARPAMFDAAVTAVMVLGGLFTAGRSDRDPELFKDRDAVAVALILACTLPYLLRRRFPATVLLVATCALTALMLADYHPGALPFTVLVGAYTVGSEKPAHDATRVAAGLGLVLVLLAAGEAPSFGTAELALSAVAYGGAMLLGHSMRSRSERIEAFAQEQEEAALRAAADERLRIAQEMHDVVAHSLGVIAVQAGVGMHVIDTDPAEAKRSLEHISQTSRTSLAEIRRLLGLVRGTTGAPSYTPAPGLADISRLAEEVSGAGLEVALILDGDMERVPPGVGLAAYRIVQEALTNAIRHAQAHRADVRLASTPQQLSIEVCDDGRGPHTPPGRRRGSGHGLVGMRERVAVYGGTLETGPAPGRGFRIAADLPFDAEHAL